jgi:3-methyladenine DNA glycosylase/8-oxoguanine DNA glycosylase
MRVTLTASLPFDFYNTVRSHGWYQLAPTVWDEDTRTLHRPERLPSGRVTLLSLKGVPGGLSVDLADKLGDDDLAVLNARLAWMFWLDADLSEFYAQADHEPRLAHCRAQAMGRMLRSTTLFEDVVKMMLTTNIQWAGTRRLSKALVDYFGDPVEGNPTLRAFPRPERIARSRESTLRTLGLGYRAPYLLKLARDVASGRTDLEALIDPGTALPTPELRKRLLALPGIGPYAAAALLAMLGRHDFIPIDTEAVSAVSNFFYGGTKVGEKEINAVFERWGKHKALAYWFWDYSGDKVNLPLPDTHTTQSDR